ncbi:MAG TPA: DUF1178 family protein [Burkholderiales bacterium]|nr:DUF1178 family protein [Burkholderiales bacterium]
MIVFDLLCVAGHRFEGWFGSAADFASQRERNLLSCPSCGSPSVERVPSAARLNRGVPEPKAPAASVVPAAPGASDAPPRDPFAIAQMLYSRMLDELLSKTEDVGKQFAAEARRIHYNEAPARAIRGEATLREHEELEDEGIPVLRLPLPPSSS